MDLDKMLATLEGEERFADGFPPETVIRLIRMLQRRTAALEKIQNNPTYHYVESDRMWADITAALAYQGEET